MSDEIYKIFPADDAPIAILFKNSGKQQDMELHDDVLTSTEAASARDAVLCSIDSMVIPSEGMANYAAALVLIKRAIQKAIP